MNEIDEIIDRPINIKRLLKNLSFTAESIEDAGENQARLFEEAGALRVQMLRKKNRAEEQMKLLAAEIAMKIHNREEKITETKVKYLVTKNLKYQKAVSRYHEAEEWETYVKYLCESFDMKLWAMKIISEVGGMEAAVEKKLKEQERRLRDQKKRIQDKFGDED